MNDVGFEVRYIMYFFGYCNEVFICSYNCELFFILKKSVSVILFIIIIVSVKINDLFEDLCVIFG